MGARRARVDEHGYVLATIPESLPKGHPARGRVPRVGPGGPHGHLARRRPAPG